MTFQQLSYLLEVYQCGSVTRAAEKLFLAQSSVSAAIGSLERELGYPIFKRVKNGIVPTAQGQKAIDYARRICENLRLMQEPDPTQKKHVHLCTTDFMPFQRAFAQLVEESKEQETVFHWEADKGTFEVSKKLYSLQMDMAFVLIHLPRVLEVETRFGEQGLFCQRLGTVPAAIVIGPGHPMYDKEDLTLEDLQEELLVDSGEGLLVNNAFLKGIVHLNPDWVVYASNWNIRNELLTRGSAYTIGVGTYTREDRELGLRKVPIRDLQYMALAVRNSNDAAQSEYERMTELICKEMKEL